MQTMAIKNYCETYEAKNFIVLRKFLIEKKLKLTITKYLLNETFHVKTYLKKRSYSWLVLPKYQFA